MNLTKVEKGKIVSQWTINNVADMREMAEMAIAQCQFPKGVTAEIREYGFSAIYVVADDSLETKIYIC